MLWFPQNCHGIRINLTWAHLQVYTNMYPLLQLLSPVTDMWAPLVIFLFLLWPALLYSFLSQLSRSLPTWRGHGQPPLPQRLS
jgi:hypothetical protein